MADLLLGGIAINEVLADPNGAFNFDTDGNGTAHETDEFIELVNTSGTAIDISGLEMWDAGIGHYFTFPPGSILQPGAHALVMAGVQSGGSLPTGGPDDLFFDLGRNNAFINNGGDNIIVYDPAADEYINVTFNGDAQDDPTLGAGGYSGFSPTATQSGSGENFGNDTDGQSLQRTSDGTDVITSDTPTPGVTNVCFVAGTVFDTPNGPKAVETLAHGDLVTTMDHGAQAVAWIYAVTWSAADVVATAALAPVRISKGALGAGLPRRDLLVSQQHRIMVRGAIALRMFDCVEVLVAAKHLTVLPGVRLDKPARDVTYYHVMTAQHDVLFAEGTPTESLFLGAETLRAIPATGLRELELLMGMSVAQMRAVQANPARPFAQGKRAKTLVRRHRRNNQPVMSQLRPEQEGVRFAA